MSLFAVESLAGASTEHVYKADPTRFGNIEYMMPSHDVLLNGKLLIKSGQKKDMFNRPMSLYREDVYAAPTGGRKDVLVDGKTISRRLIDRVLISEAGIGTCSQHFIIVDLRGSAPYVTNSFGNNPRGEYCFTVKKIKWGKKESLVHFENGTKYLYPTGQDVFGPVE